MDISTLHAAARLQACRIPALSASLSLLASADASRATIEFHAAPRPGPGEPAGDDPLAIGQLTGRAGIIDPVGYALVLDAPIEAQVVNADPATGTPTAWARVKTPAGAWWADLSVSSTADGTGEILIEQTLLLNGAFVRVTAGTVQG